MSLFTTPLGQALITLGTAGIIALITTVIKMSGRMSRIEGKMELMIGMLERALDSKSADSRRIPRRRSKKGDGNCE